MEALLMYLPLAAVAITLGSVLVSHERRYAALEQRIAKLETKIEPFWDCVRNNLGAIWAAENNSPNRAIIAKLSNGTITWDEARDLERQLSTYLHSGQAHDSVAVLLTLCLLGQEQGRMRRGDVCELCP